MRTMRLEGETTFLFDGTTWDQGREVRVRAVGPADERPVTLVARVTGGNDAAYRDTPPVTLSVTRARRRP